MVPATLHTPAVRKLNPEVQPTAMFASAPWIYWALLSAVFAALTAIFAKIGIQGVDSDLATLVRTAIIIVVLSEAVQ
jgi:hypothetical protein